MKAHEHSAKPTRQQPVGEVRIIGGQWKRSKLGVPNKPGLRPTPSRVRETLFNWLGPDLSGLRCLDAFAGTGALGLEAASRGAADVLLIEHDPQLVANLRDVQTRWKAQTVRVQRGDGLAVMQALPAGSMDLVFLDPPFDSGLFGQALRAAARILSDQGAIYLEAPEVCPDAWLLPLQLRRHKSGQAGMVHYHLLVRGSASEPDAHYT